MATNQGVVDSNRAGRAPQTKGWIVLRRPCVMSGRDLASVPPHPRHRAFDVQRSQIPRPSDRFVTLLGVIAGIAVPGITRVGSDPTLTLASDISAESGVAQGFPGDARNGRVSRRERASGEVQDRGGLLDLQ